MMSSTTAMPKEHDAPRGGLARGILAGTRLLNVWLTPLVLLAVRLWIGNVFFRSGQTKIADWETTKLLFSFEYPVPLLSPNLAAILATGFELVCPVLLAVGLFTRLAALPLLAMALVIQFSLGAANPDYDNVEHFYWMLLLLVLIARGGGAISIDAALVRFTGGTADPR